MKIIEPAVEIYREPDHFKKIETIARVCTGTQDKVGTKPGFVENLLKREHMTPFEHVRVELTEEQYTKLRTVESPEERLLDAIFGRVIDTYGQSYRIKHYKYYKSPWKEKTHRKRKFVSLNARDFFAVGGTLEELKDLPAADDYMTVKFTCDIGISRELIRHRQFSFQERSTRYVNMKDGIEFIRPVPFEDLEKNDWWKTNCAIAECNYQHLILQGLHPQSARAVLPLSTATILYVTGTINQWKDMLKLRLDKAAHPQMRYLMQMLVSLPDCPVELKEYAEEIANETVEI